MRSNGTQRKGNSEIEPLTPGHVHFLSCILDILSVIFSIFFALVLLLLFVLLNTHENASRFLAEKNMILSDL